MVGLQTLDLAIGVRVPASQPKIKHNRATQIEPPVCVLSGPTVKCEGVSPTSSQ